MEWYCVWWPWLTTKCVARVCQYKVSFLLVIGAIQIHDDDNDDAEPSDDFTYLLVVCMRVCGRVDYSSTHRGYEKLTDWQRFSYLPAAEFALTHSQSRRSYSACIV